MKITICTSGSRGDTQPYIALGLELVKRGHEVTIGTEERMRSLVESFPSLRYHCIAGDPTGLLWEKDAQEMLRDGKVMALLKRTEEYNAPFFKPALKDYEAACEGAETIISGPLCMNQLYSLAERNKVPFVCVLLGPTKSGDFPLPFLKGSSLGMKFLNRLSWQFVFMALWQNEKKRINPWRVGHLKLNPVTEWTGIASRYDDGLPLILAINRHIIPNSTVPPDWPKHFKMPGFFFVEDTPADQIDPVIRSFVENQEKPIVYLGFGSMPAPEPLALIKRAVNVSKQLDVRVVLCAGWSDLDQIVNPSANNLVVDEGQERSEAKIDLPENLLLIKAVPHDYLFPLCSVVVHHCGVGTCAATMKAGTPSVCCPVMLDQPYNAGRLHEVGIAPPPIPFHQMNSNNLIEALKIVLKSEKMKSKAKSIAEEIRQESGVVGAADYIEHLPNPFLPNKRS